MNRLWKIVVRGRLVPQWAAAIFEGMEVICLPDGNTCIAGILPDQSALYGLLMRLRDFGLELVSIHSYALEEKK